MYYSTMCAKTKFPQDEWTKGCQAGTTPRMNGEYKIITTDTDDTVMRALRPAYAAI